MKRLMSRIVVAGLFLMVTLAAVPAPAAAHDQNCASAVHAGPAKLHVACESKYRGDNRDCALMVNVGPVHEDLGCD